MNFELFKGIMIPFFGTCLGAGTVFFMKNSLSDGIRRALTGFAAGVMTAASIWSLLIPSIERSEAMGAFAFVPAAAGFWAGVAFLVVLGRCSINLGRLLNAGSGDRVRRTAMLVLAVVLHNLPEGMAVGVVYAGWLQGWDGVTLAGALALAIGIAIQNFPEGAIISMPLHAEGVSKGKSFVYGVLSGAVEPAGAFLTIIAARFVTTLLPYLLSFAAGAMVYVVVEELIPEMSHGKHSNVGTIMFAAGFTVMMALDVALG